MQCSRHEAGQRALWKQSSVVMSLGSLAEGSGMAAGLVPQSTEEDFITIWH